MDRRFLRAAILLAIPVALAGCGKKTDAAENLDSLDAELTDANSAGNTRDPALMAALHDQIMVDPALTQTSNANAIRPPSRPDTGAVPVPVAAKDTTDPAQLKSAPAPSPDCPDCKAAKGALTLGALASQQANRSVADCAAKIGYSAGWANRLPKGLALYPDAQVSEAAGTNRDGCTLRIVSFHSAAPMQRVIDWYYTRATAAGYSAGHSTDGAQHVLGGVRGAAAYVAYFTMHGGGGTDVDLVANAGT